MVAARRAAGRAGGAITREAARFRRQLELTGQRQPLLLPWLARRPLRALELDEAGLWEHLLAVVGWMRAHPRPAVYLRQIDIAGVHSKFIEGQRAVLAELLDLALPAAAIDAAHGGVAGFARRYGFLDKPARVRLRVLDDSLGLLPGSHQADVELDAASFAALALPVRQVFINENEINFLAFPPVPRSLVLFGAGYGWQALARARWLQGCAVRYWGDIDTHGYAILDQLRVHCPGARSFLMDRATLMAHQAVWGHEADQARHDLPRLDDAERALYDSLRDNRIAPGLRLEQELVGFNWLLQALEGLPPD